MADMLTVLEIIKRSTDFLASKGVESARLNAELLIGSALGLKRMALYMQFERPLTEPELEKIRPLVKRRSLREPLQYILGETEFHGLKLKVDRRALIPRPETELLVEFVIEAYPVGVATEGAAAESVATEAGAATEGTGSGAAVEDAKTAAEGAATNPVLSAAPRSILDLGTGSGAIALALAQKFPAATVMAVDLSEDALGLARENALATGLQGRVNFARSNWFGGIASGQRFDLIVANPPYLSAEETAATTPEVRGYEPAGALTAADNGLADLRTIIAEAPRFLAGGGLLALETGIAQHAELLQLTAKAGFARSESRKDLTGRERFVLAWV